MRQWCSGHGTPPASVFGALSPRLTHLEVSQRTIDSNDSIITAIDKGRMTGVGYGSGPSASDSAKRTRGVLREEERRASIVAAPAGGVRSQANGHLRDEQRRPVARV